MEQRVPPQNVEAEQAVLGAMLLSHDAVILAMERLQSHDFYRDVHRVIFEGMEHLHRENKEIDVITLTEELRRMKRLDDVGGVEYVLQLPNMVATAANIEYHANIVSEKALARNLISTCTELTTEAYDGEKGAGGPPRRCRAKDSAAVGYEKSRRLCLRRRRRRNDPR